MHHAVAFRLHPQHQSVNRLTLLGELPVDRKRARDVRGIAAILATRINEQVERAGFNGFIVAHVMQRRGVGS